MRLAPRIIEDDDHLMKSSTSEIMRMIIAGFVSADFGASTIFILTRPSCERAIA